MGGGEHKGASRRRKDRRDDNEAAFFIHELLLKMEIPWIFFSLFFNVISVFAAEHSLLSLGDRPSVRRCGQRRKVSHPNKSVFLLL